jgi:small redox-active disulfide protein 2
MKIEILGTGCAKCKLLEETAKAAAEKLGVSYQLEHVRDIREFARRGVMFTPALLVDGKVLTAGKVPSEPELARMLGGVLAK